MSIWLQKTLSQAPLELIDGDRGTNYPSKKDFLEDGFCLFLNAGNVTSRGFIFSETMFIDEERDQLLRKGKLQRGDVILTTRGTVGNVAYYGDDIDFEHVRINSGMVILRTIADELDARFMYFFLRSRFFANQVEALTTGSAQPQLPIRDMVRISMPNPPIDEQVKIVSILSALDDKIENNRRINETLEEMARAIFKSWFVDFEPVHAKADGNAPAHMDAETAAMFPSSFGDDGFPLGWSQKNVSEIFDFTMGQSPPGSTYNEKKNGIPFWQGRRDFGFRFPSNRVYCTAPTRFADEDDTLISVRAPVGDVNRALERSCIGRGVATLMHKSKLASYTYYTALQLRKQFKVHEASGTVFGSINKTEFGKLKIVFSDGGIEDMFEGLVSPLDSKILNNHLESETLENLRDTLLPKLMSGEIRVADAEREVEAL